MRNQPIYLDYNATTPVDDQVLEVMLPYFREKFGNAASIQHPLGWDAEEAVGISREQVANLIGTKPQNIVFASGATEAINLAILGAFNAGQAKDHIITSKTEHKAVLDTCEYLESKGVLVTYLGVNADGLIDIDELGEAISEHTLLVSIMAANNETGVLQDVRKIGEVCRESQVLFFSDITQAVGKIPFNIQEINIDLAACSSHKLYGPKGVGALYIRDSSLIEPQIYGGGHEKGLRSGTLNVPGIVGFGKACEVAGLMITQEGDRLKKLRNRIESELAQIGGVSVNGSKAERLPHVSNLTFEDADGNKLMRSLKGIAVSQGSACNSAVIEPSHVLRAMGLSDQLAYASLRLSLGRPTTDNEVDDATQIIKTVIEKQRMRII